MRRFLDRRLGEPGIVHVFGDSHSAVMRDAPGVVVHALPGTTMFRVGRDRAWFLHRTNRRVGRRSVLLLIFGEIDARAHIGRVAAEMSRPVPAVIEELVATYLDAVAAARRGRRVAICAVTPPATNEMAATADLPVFGTIDARLAITGLLNEALQRGAMVRGFLFCSPYDGYADGHGRLRPELSDGNVHIDRAAAGRIIAAVEAALMPLRASSARRTAW
jgi:hypothetical protein